MAQSLSSSASNTSECTTLKRNSTDVGCEYAVLANPNNRDRTKCLLCGNEYSGGINRMKEHIARIKGNVAPCSKSTKEDQEKCKKALEETKGKKREKREVAMKLREEVQVGGLHILDEEDDDGVEVTGSKKKPHFLGPMDKFANPINPNWSAGKQLRQQNLNDAISKKKSHEVSQYLARWVYEASIPFNAIDNDTFKRFVEAVGQFGPGYQPPTQYQLREPLLKEEVERTKTSLKKHEEEWASTGCSIMTDAWSDRKRRSIMNLCVNCKQGTSFISSKEDSLSSHTADYIFDYVDKVIDEIGAKNVVQIVTDNASNNMAVANLLKEKRPTIYWTSCATHTINLMLEGIGKLKSFKEPIEKAKKFTIFVYAHHKTLALMRKYTKKSDIVSPGATRFATAFLTLESLMDKKHELRKMVNSKEWEDTKASRLVKGKEASAIVSSPTFWTKVNHCLDVFGPLFMILRLVDGDWKPSMGFVYGELKQAKEDIKEVYKQHEASYRPILDIIDEKANGRLDRPLHLTAYFLNPFYFFKDPTMKDDANIMDGVVECVEAFFPDNFDMQDEVINNELIKYKNKEGAFGKAIAAKGCQENHDRYDPVGWWSNYGNHTPNLKRMTTRILSLTLSSSGCERNWSTFERIHTKKRNRLDATRLNNLVYVQFNAKLINNKKRRKEKKREVLLSNDAIHAQGWIVEKGDDGIDPILGLTYDVIGEAMGADEYLEPRRSGRNVEVRELDEDDFVSEDDDDEEVDVDFECDDDEGIVTGGIWRRRGGVIGYLVLFGFEL